MALDINQPTPHIEASIYYMTAALNPIQFYRYYVSVSEHLCGTCWIPLWLDLDNGCEARKQGWKPFDGLRNTTAPMLPCKKWHLQFTLIIPI